MDGEKKDWQRHQNKLNYRSSCTETLFCQCGDLMGKKAQKKSLQVGWLWLSPSSISCIDVWLRKVLEITANWNFLVCVSYPSRKLKTVTWISIESRGNDASWIWWILNESWCRLEAGFFTYGKMANFLFKKHFLHFFSS